MKRLAIVSTHPIQYNAPFFQALAATGKVTVKVFYTWGQSCNGVYDPAFGRNLQWDLPLLEGYQSAFVPNVATRPGAHHFRGIINPTLIKEIARWKADAILVYGWCFQSHLKLMRHFHRKIPVIFRGDSTLMSEQRQMNFKILARRIFLRWVYRHIDYALYAGKANRLYFIKHGVKEDRLLFAPHAIDNSRFSANPDVLAHEAARWRRQLGISKQGCVFLYAGKLTVTKNVDFLIQAFLTLQAPGSALVLVGEGVMERRLRHRCQDAKNIYFLGFQNQTNMPVVYRLGNVFVLPSRSDTWGLCLNEAMACGLGILSSNRCGGSLDLVRQGYNGYVFSPDDTGSLVHAMRLSLDQHRLFGQRSLRLIQSFSYEASVQQLTRILDHL